MTAINQPEYLQPQHVALLTSIRDNCFTGDNWEYRSDYSLKYFPYFRTHSLDFVRLVETNHGLEKLGVTFTATPGKTLRDIGFKVTSTFNASSKNLLERRELSVDPETSVAYATAQFNEYLQSITAIVDECYSRRSYLARPEEYQKINTRPEFISNYDAGFSEGYMDNKMALLDLLVQCGWNACEYSTASCTTGIATKSYDIFGDRTQDAVLYFRETSDYSDLKGEVVGVLSGEFTSAGRNELVTHDLNIYRDESPTLLMERLYKHLSDANVKIDQSLARRVYFNHLRANAAVESDSSSFSL